VGFALGFWVRRAGLGLDFWRLLAALEPLAEVARLLLAWALFLAGPCGEPNMDAT